MTLKQGQGPETWQEAVDSKEGYNHAKVERACLNSVGRKKKSLSFHSISKHISYLPRIGARVIKNGLLILFLFLSSWHS